MLTTDGALRDQIRGLFSEHMNVEVPSHETDLLESGLLDSMGLVDLLVHIEKTFGLTIGLEDLNVEDFRSVATIAAVVKGRLPGVQARPA